MRTGPGATVNAGKVIPARGVMAPLFLEVAGRIRLPLESLAGVLQSKLVLLVGGSKKKTNQQEKGKGRRRKRTAKKKGSGEEERKRRRKRKGRQVEELTNKKGKPRESKPTRGPQVALDRRVRLSPCLSCNSTNEKLPSEGYLQNL